MSYVKKLGRLASFVPINDVGVYGFMCVGVYKRRGEGIVSGYYVTFNPQEHV